MGDVVRFQDARRRREEAPLVDPEQPRADLPPHDLEAERAVLSAVLLDGARHVDGSASALDRALEVLTPEHFFDLANGRVYQAAQALAASSTPVDAITVRSWLDEQGWIGKVGGAVYLAELCDASPDIANVAAHAEKVFAAWEDRQLLATAQMVAAQARRPHEAEGGRDAFRARARASLGAVTAPRVQLVGAPMGAIVQQVRDQIDASQREQVAPGIPLPFDALADFGLMQQGTQQIVTGRPGMGKTGFTFQVTRRVVEAEPVQGIGEAVYWWCGEMDPAALVMREAANHCGIKFHHLQSGRLHPARWEAFSRALQRFERLPIWWDHEPCTPEELAARVCRMKALFEAGKARREPGPGEVAGRLFPKCRLRLVAIDQLSELKPPAGLSPRAEKREIVGATAKATRALIAKKLKVHTLLLAQLNRPKDPKNVDLPALTDLRESGMIEEGADDVIAIHRRQYYTRQRTSDEWKNVAEILKLKGRYGEADDARLGFFSGRFSDRLPPAALGQPHYETHDDDVPEDDR